MRPSLQKRLETFFVEYLPYSNTQRATTLRPLTDSEKQELNWLQLNATYKGRGNIPVYGYDSAPFLNPHQKEKIEAANRVFCRGLVILLENRNNGVYTTQKEFAKQFRFRVKEWAIEADLFNLLFSTLF